MVCVEFIVRSLVVHWWAACTLVRRRQGRNGGSRLLGEFKLKSVNLELMELENIVANTVYLKAREGNCICNLNYDNGVLYSKRDSALHVFIPLGIYIQSVSDLFWCKHSLTLRFQALTFSTCDNMTSLGTRKNSYFSFPTKFLQKIPNFLWFLKAYAIVNCSHRLISGAHEVVCPKNQNDSHIL